MRRDESPVVASSGAAMIIGLSRCGSVQPAHTGCFTNKLMSDVTRVWAIVAYNEYDPRPKLFVAFERGLTVVLGVSSRAKTCL